MSQTVEFESKSVEKAVQEASEKLNIPAAKLKHDVISYGSTGIFGLVGTKKAKIRVVVPDSIQQEKEENFREKTEEETKTAIALVDETFGKDDKAETVDENAVVLGRTVLQKFINFITLDASIVVNRNGEKIVFNVIGGNTAILIGKRGQTLEAMQYLVEKIVNKQCEKRVRIEIDVEGYLGNKREKLESLALKMSEKAKRTNKPVTVGQLNAHDRRIVHIILKDDREIRTHSMGEGYYRKLKIFPKHCNRKSDRRQTDN